MIKKIKMSTKLNETTGYEIAGLTMDLMSKLRKGVISIEEFKNFLIMKTFDRRKIFGVTCIEEHPKMKFVSSNNLVDELSREEFYPEQHFVGGKVKYWLGDNFKKYVLNPVKVISNLPQMSFSKHKFIENITDEEIMKYFQISKSGGLMTREEILWTIAFLTSKQPSGDSGILLTNGYATLIGYMLCDDNVVRAVCVDWFSGDARWFCDCFDLDSWAAGDEMLSRNEIL